MKEKIKYFYNLDVYINDNIIYDNDGNYYKYILYERNIKDIEDLNKICYELWSKNIKCNNIVKNIFNSFISDNFVLIKYSYFLNDYIDFDDLIKYSNILETNNIDIKWNILWENRVDYLENKMNNVRDEYVIYLFNYYVGLAENAITMFNRINKKYEHNTKIVLSRNRVKYPYLLNDYFNPVEFIFDSRVRDISEYLKSKYFNGLDIIEDINKLLLEDYSIYEYNLLFCRLLYPTYFFDLLDDYFINGNINFSDEYILKYQNTLNEIYYIFSKKCYIEKIDWLIKKEL